MNQPQIYQDLMTAMNEASTALKEKIKSELAAGKQPSVAQGGVFNTSQEVEDFFKPFFEKQNEVNDLVFFVNIVALHMQFWFIVGGVLKPGGNNFEIKQP